MPESFLRARGCDREMERGRVGDRERGRMRERGKGGKRESEGEWEREGERGGEEYMHTFSAFLFPYPFILQI